MNALTRLGGAMSLLVALLGSSPPALAQSAWSGTGTVESILVAGNVLYVRLQSETPTDFQCGTPGLFWMAKPSAGDNGYQEIYTLLLTAKTTGQRVNILATNADAGGGSLCVGGAANLLAASLEP